MARAPHAIPGPRRPGEGVLSARDIVLDFTGDANALARLAGHVPDDAETLRLADIRARGTVATLRALRETRRDRAFVVVGEIPKPRRWLTMLALGLVARAKSRSVVDLAGRERDLTPGGFLGREVPFVIRRAIATRRAIARCMDDIGALEPPGPLAIGRPSRVLMVRTDLGPAIDAGGSVAHLRGVASGFRRLGAEVLLVSPAGVAGFGESGIPLELVPEDPANQMSVELPSLAYNRTLSDRLPELIEGFRPDLVYLRHGLGSYAAALAARRAGLPLVVEFNGSEVWVASHWGAARSHLDAFATIEGRVLRAAHLVVAVSEPLRDPLREAGVPDARVLIRPNGVDADLFDPAARATDREEVRGRLGYDDATVVVGFVGTFGPWHGAEVLARAIAAVPRIEAPPIRALFIGDGPRRLEASRILEAAGRREAAHFTGLVPQHETPRFLAACDIAASPHVPNADGSPFFGSPTKLFEYLASGRAIVASRLGQLDEVLEHGRNAWLVPPGDDAALADALSRLARDRELRERLGTTGRRDALDRHTWTSHVEAVVSALVSTGATP